MVIEIMRSCTVFFHLNPLIPIGVLNTGSVTEHDSVDGGKMRFFPLCLLNGCFISTSN